MKYHDLTPAELIRQLNEAGRYPLPDLIDAVWERQVETEPVLLEVFNDAFDDDWPGSDDPRWYRFVHAGKFLLAWQNRDAIPTFARLYGSDDDVIQNWCEWFEEDLFQFGPPIIPYLKTVAGKDSDNKWDYGMALSGSILTRVAIHYPETREEVTAILRALLPPLDAIPSVHDDMWGNWAAELGELADETSRDHILALANTGALSEEFFSHSSYLRSMSRGFRPQKPPPSYDIRADYRSRYEQNLERNKRVARERERQRKLRIRAATTRAEPKVGRNEPCPCGSGRKYKKCHGRPGA